MKEGRGRSGVAGERKEEGGSEVRGGTRKEEMREEIGRGKRAPDDVLKACESWREGEGEGE